MSSRRRPSEESLLNLFMLLVGLAALTFAVTAGFFVDIAVGNEAPTPTPTPPPPTATASATPTPSATPTASPTLTPTPTLTPSPTDTPVQPTFTPIPPTPTILPPTFTPIPATPTFTPKPSEPGVGITCTSSLSTGTAPDGQQKGMMSAYANEAITCTATVTGFYESVAWASLTSNGSNLTFTTSLPNRGAQYSTSMRLQVNWGGNPVIKYMDVQVLPASCAASGSAIC